MRLRTDDPAWRVQFVFRGDERTGSTLPVEARPQTWIRAVLAGVVCTILAGAVWAGPVAIVQPGPVGVLVTASIAVVFGVALAAIVASALARYDTVETPLRHNLRALAADVRAERPQADHDVTTSLDGLWPATSDTETPSPASALFRRSHATRVPHRSPMEEEDRRAAGDG